jgi:hypothetical protein
VQYLLFSGKWCHTSEIEFALVERVEVGEGVVDQLCREPHDGVSILRADMDS